MPKSPDTSTINKTKEQYKITIPKPLAEALKLQTGQKVRWKVTGKGKLEVIIINY